MHNLLKILILEDIPEDAGLIDKTLEKAKIPFVSLRVDTRDEFIDAIKTFSPDVILSDHSLPQFNSIEALKICQTNRPNIPFILVTGTVSEEFAVNSLKEGADDYLLKGNLTRLPSAILNSLKQKQDEKTRKKAEESLKEQNIELVKINQELDRFVYSASHDLKAPLKSVLGLLKLAEGDLQSENYHSMGIYHKMIEGSVFKLDATIKEIENYSRNIRTNIVYKEIDLRIMAEEVLESLRYTDGLDLLKTYLKFGNNSLLVSDPARLRIILSNIISNAIKYRDDDKEESYLSISAEISDIEAIIRIEDNGIGISTDYIDKIYNMFYRATEKSEGSGLGLYIVKETIDKLKGTITVESVLKEKTLFTITIPNNIDQK